MNIVTITGRLASEVELRRVTVKGEVRSVAQFRICPLTRKGQPASFFSVVVWGPRADSLFEHCGKGRKVCINGRLEQRTWGEDDARRSRVEIVASEVEFLDFAKPKESEETSHDGNLTIDWDAVSDPGYDAAVGF